MKYWRECKVQNKQYGQIPTDIFHPVVKLMCFSHTIKKFLIKDMWLPQRGKGSGEQASAHLPIPVAFHSLECRVDVSSICPTAQVLQS